MKFYIVTTLNELPKKVTTLNNELISRVCLDLGPEGTAVFKIKNKFLHRMNSLKNHNKQYDRFSTIL